MQKGLLVVFVQNHEFFRVIQHMDFFAQKAHAKAVERRNVAAVVAAQHRANALFHFVRGLVGKRDAQNVRRRNSHLLHQIQVTLGQRPGFTGPSPCHHAHKALGGFHRFPLFQIQAFQIHIF